MAKFSGWLHSVEWSNSHTNPPAEAPRILAEVFTLEKDTPIEFQNFSYSLGGGYSKTIRYVAEASGKELSKEVLASVRKKRLVRRVKAKVPMFADFFIEQEIQRKAEYYDGITDGGLQQAREEVLAHELERFEFFKANVNKVFIYADEPNECKEKAARLRVEMLAIQ
ncbi:MAG: hypothetical protein HZB19_15260 [Chloroflexi bacterium]|nr:hypothetical protein [Chloroflexota bacterium]